MHQTPIVRRKTRKIRVGSVYVGGDAPISVQTMTNTETCDVDATVAQINRCVNAGADIVRVSVPSMQAAEALKILLGTEPQEYSRLHVYNALSGRWQSFALTKNRQCRVCGPKAV